MFTLFHRRQFLRAGGLGLFGLGLADLLRLEAQSDAPRRPKSIIYIILGGGPSHLDTWDLKPEAPAEYRGEFKPIDTNLAGVQLCELFPKQATIMDRVALLRGVRSIENDHFLSEVYSGLPRTAGQRPCFGSIVSRVAPNKSAIPTYVSLRKAGEDRFEFEKPHYAGPGHGPFRPFGEALNNLAPVKDLEQLNDRKALLAGFDSVRRDLDRSGVMDGLDQYQARALEMMTSPKVREAFDLTREPIQNIARYGKGKYTHQAVKDLLYDWDVKPWVLARRLVEAGVRVVTIATNEWDHHSGPQQQIFESYRHVLPILDQCIHALITDLHDRGLSEDVLVVVLGEFGRTPKLAYPGPGREHWADAGCVLLSGGGLKMGQVVGETDSKGLRAKSGDLNFQNLFATLYTVLGVDLETILPDFNGRPQYLLDQREPIRELLS
jgi:hypothetical protein